MIVVDHIHVVQIGGSRFVRDVDGVRKGKVPNREGFKLRITCFHAALIFVIKLGKASRHFTASGTGGGNHYQTAFRRDVFVSSVAFFAYDFRYVRRVSFNGVVLVYGNAEIGQTLDKAVHGRLRLVHRHNHAANVQALALENIDKANDVRVVGNSKVAAVLILHDIVCVNDDKNFRNRAELQQHFDFTVGLKTGQNAGRVVVVEELTAEFEVELVAERVDAFLDFFRLQRQILLVIEPDFVHKLLLCYRQKHYLLQYSKFEKKSQGSKRGKEGLAGNFLQKKDKPVKDLPFR